MKRPVQLGILMRNFLFFQISKHLAYIISALAFFSGIQQWNKVHTNDYKSFQDTYKKQSTWSSLLGGQCLVTNHSFWWTQCYSWDEDEWATILILHHIGSIPVALYRKLSSSGRKPPIFCGLLNIHKPDVNTLYPWGPLHHSLTSYFFIFQNT